jgi:predicted aspartyl protease
LQVSDDGLFVEVSINGVSGYMLIDTGAYLTTVDNHFAAQAKLKPYRATNVRMTDAAGVETEPEWADPASFKIGGNEAMRTKIQVQPLSFYQPSGGKVVGLLGMDFIGQSWGIIDFAQRKIYFAGTK